MEDATRDSTNSISERSWMQRLPRAPYVDRRQFIVESCRLQSVVHIGFVDAECAHTWAETGICWLHKEIAGVATSLVGLDVDVQGVLGARKAHYNAHKVDCTIPSAVHELGLPLADVVVAGEVLEHLDNPGAFLEAMKCLLKPEGILILTTPNASRLFSALSAMFGIEITHPDHVAAYSYSTLGSLLQRHNWAISAWLVYGSIRESTKEERSLAFTIRHPRTAIFRVATRLEWATARSWARFTAPGLIAVCRNPTMPR